MMWCNGIAVTSNMSYNRSLGFESGAVATPSLPTRRRPNNLSGRAFIMSIPWAVGRRRPVLYRRRVYSTNRAVGVTYILGAVLLHTEIFNPVQYGHARAGERVAVFGRTAHRGREGR